MLYDELAERRLKEAIRAAYSAEHINSGRYVSFAVQGRVSVSEADLLRYCDEWLPTARVRFDTNGFRPALVSDVDRTMIGTNTGGGSVYVQGRMEAVVVLAPIAAAFALGIAPSVAKVLPSTRYFWDGLEKYGRLHPHYSTRPPTTLPDPSTGGKKELEVWELACQDKSAVTSKQIYEYFALSSDRSSVAWGAHAKKIWPDSLEFRFAEAVRDLQLRPLARYLNPGSLAEANRLIARKVEEMMASRTNSWCGVDMSYPNRIHTGEFIFYLTSIWPDCVLTKCGTRWRPRVLPDGSEKGSVYLSSPEDKNSGGGATSIACIGKVSLAHAWMPLMAACSLMIDPAVAARTEAFKIFWDSVASSFEASLTLPNPYRSGAFVSGQSTGSGWATEADMADWNCEKFGFENDLCKRLFYLNLHILTNTSGFWSGGDALPGVSLSRNDFVDWIFLWEPDAYVESVGRFRVRPAYLEKGGIGVEKGGAYFSIQTSNDPAMAMLVILSSVMAGIPPAVAALCEFANPFWDFAFARTNSQPQIAARRNYLRQLRAFNVAGPVPRSVPSSSSLVFDSPKIDLSEITGEITAKLRSFELCNQRSLVMAYNAKMGPQEIAQVENRIKNAVGGFKSERFQEVNSEKLLTFLPTNCNFEIQLKLSVDEELSLALRRLPNVVPNDARVLQDLLVEIFMVNKPRHLLTHVQQILSDRLVRNA